MQVKTLLGHAGEQCKMAKLIDMPSAGLCGSKWPHEMSNLMGVSPEIKSYAYNFSISGISKAVYVLIRTRYLEISFRECVFYGFSRFLKKVLF